LQDRRAQGQVRESQFQMKIDNLLGHISRSYQIDLRRFASDEAAFEKVLRAQAKKRGNADDLGSARASRALVDDHAPGDDQEKSSDADPSAGISAKAPNSAREGACAPQKSIWNS